jgi:hypothetical protein
MPEVPEILLRVLSVSLCKCNLTGILEVSTATQEQFAGD